MGEVGLKAGGWGGVMLWKRSREEMNLGGGKLSVLVGGWGREREAEGFLAWEWNSVIHLLFVWICLYSGPGSPPCSTRVLLINPLFNEASTDANLWLAGFWENVPQLSFLNVLAALEIFLCAPVPATCSVTRSDVWPCAPRVVWRRTRLNLECYADTRGLRCFRQKLRKFSVT